MEETREHIYSRDDEERIASTYFTMPDGQESGKFQFPTPLICECGILVNLDNQRMERILKCQSCGAKYTYDVQGGLAILYLVEEREAELDPAPLGMWFLPPDAKHDDYGRIMTQAHDGYSPDGRMVTVVGVLGGSGAKLIVDEHNRIVKTLNERTAWQVLKDSGLKITMDKDGVQVEGVSDHEG